MGRDHLGQFLLNSNANFGRGIMLLEDCEGTFNWTVSGTGGDDTHEYATAAAFIGTNGIHMKTRVTSAATNDTLRIAKILDYPASGLIVFRARFNWPDNSNVALMRLDLDVSRGNQLIRYRIVLEPGAPEIYYLDSGNNEVDNGGGLKRVYDNQWGAVELVVDANNGEYRYVQQQGWKWDLSGQAGYEVSQPDEKGVTLAFELVASSEAPAEAYLDQIYLGEFLDI